MARLLVDEDLPRSTARALRQAGHEAEDVRDVGLQGHSDGDVFARAQAIEATLVTADLGFSNIINFPPGTHAGIIVVRVPDILPSATLNAELLRALNDLPDADRRGSLVIVELGRIRIRRAPAPRLSA